MANRPPKTLEELHAGFLRHQLGLKQNREKLASGEITRDELSRRALVKAEEQFRKNAERQEGIAKASDNVRLSIDEIEDYRQGRLEAYRENFEWNEALDAASLDALVELEVQLHIIKHDLQMPKLNVGEKQKLMDAMLDMASKSADLRIKLGVDRKSREAARTNKSPVEKMDEQVNRFALNVKERIDKFPSVADNVNSERDLREAARYFLLLDFRFVDTLIRNVKRLNGLEPTVEQYE